VRVHLGGLLLQESAFFLEQINSIERVIGAEQLVQATAVSGVLLDGMAISHQQMATAFEAVLALGFQPILPAAAHLVENLVHPLHWGNRAFRVDGKVS